MDHEIRSDIVAPSEKMIDSNSDLDKSLLSTNVCEFAYKPLSIINSSSSESKTLDDTQLMETEDTFRTTELKTQNNGDSLVKSTTSGENKDSSIEDFTENSGSSDIVPDDTNGNLKEAEGEFYSITGTDSKCSNNSNNKKETKTKNDDSVQSAIKEVEMKQTKPNSAPNDGNPKSKTIPFVGENMIRMNYLYQVSKFVACQHNSKDSSALGALSTSVGRKGVIRVSSELKRQFCKGCGGALIAGVTCKFRLRKNRQKHLVVTCDTCKTIKRFVTDSNHSLWCDQPEAIA